MNNLFPLLSSFCRHGRPVLLALWLPWHVASAARTDWPGFLGPDGNGISGETGIRRDWNTRPPQERWRVALSDNGYAGPAAAQGKLVIIDRDGEDDVVRAFNLRTGAEVWRFAYPEPGRHAYGFARTTPAIDGEFVFTLSREGRLHALCFENGTQLWGRDILSDFNGRMPRWKMAMSPRVDGERLIVTPGGADAAVVALDKRTGKTLWQGGGSDFAGYATPVIATIGGVRQYVVFTGRSVIGVDPETGDQLWRQEWVTRHDINAASPRVWDDTVFISSGYGRGSARLRIGRDGADILWENREMQAHFSSPILYDGMIYGTTDPGFLICLDPETGTSRWRERGFQKGGILIVDGCIIALDGRTGEVVMAEVSPKAYRELGRFVGLGGQSWTAPIIADGALVIRNKTNLAVLDLK